MALPRWSLSDGRHGARAVEPVQAVPAGLAALGVIEQVRVDLGGDRDGAVAEATAHRGEILPARE